MKKFLYQVTHSIDGFADEKFVEVDGKKFASADGKEPTKDDKGQPVPYVEKQAPVAPAFDPSKATLQELAGINPAIKQMLDDQAKAAADAKKKAEEEAGKNGEWEKLATERQGRISELEKELGTKSEIVGKYIESTKKVLDDVIKTIPKERLTLIPESFSPREKLEYIIANAALLGAKVTSAAGSVVPPNDGQPQATEEQKLQNEVNELIKKGATRTVTENNLLWEKSQALKKLQMARQNKK